MMRPVNFLTCLFPALLLWTSFMTPAAAQTAPDDAIRQQLTEAILNEDEEQAARIEAMAETGSDFAAKVLTQWRAGELFLDTAADGQKTLFTKEGGQALRLDTGAAYTPVSPKEMETSSKIRRAIRNALDLIAVASPDAKVRTAAISKLGMTQNTDYLPVLVARQAKETDKDVREALEEAIAVMQLRDEDDAVCIAAVKKLGEMRSLPCLDLLRAMTTS
jgi:hypothetical protein